MSIAITMDTDLSLAVFAATYEASCLVGKICQLVGEVRENRVDQRCERLNILAQQIQTLLDHRREALSSHNLAVEALKCVRDIHAYVEMYKEKSSLLGDAVEVLWTKKYKEHVAAAERVKEKFVFGLLSLTDFRPLARHGGKLEPKETFMIPDPLQIKWKVQDRSHGEAKIAPLGSVVCYKFSGTKMSITSLEMYPALQDRAYVQQLKGLAKINDELYVFFEDCRDHQQLQTLCKTEHLPSDLTSRVEIAFKIARTVAHYHKFGLVLKALCDTSIYLRQIPDGKKEPILTGLQHMRELTESSARLGSDWRFEAPEYAHMKEHTWRSDVWSLGIVAWQVICRRFPYGVETFVRADDEVQRNRISHSMDPGTFPEDVPESLVECLKSCWDRNPRERPEAKEVATRLQEHWLALVHESNNGSRTTRPSAAEELISRATQAQRAAEAAQLTVDVEGAISRASSAITRAKSPTSKSKTADDGLKKRREDGVRKGGGDAGGEGEEERQGGDAADGTALKVSIEDVRALLRAKKPECTYRVGACIWWEMLDETAVNYVERVRPIEYTSISQDGRRAELSLDFLLEAERGGCTDGRFEISLAYGLLSGAYKKDGEKRRGKKKASEPAVISK